VEVKNAIAMLLLALAAAPIAAQSVVEKTFAAGETLDYNVTWLGFTGATARMTIAPAAGGGLRMTSIAASTSGFARVYKVRDEIESIVNARFSTVDYRKHLDERGRIKDDRTKVDEGRMVATRTRPGKKTQEIRVMSPVFDPLSLVYHLRRLDLSPGKVHRFTVLADGKVYTLVATVLKRETLQTPAGKFRCVTVEPKMQGTGLYGDDDESSLLISYSDDEFHIPVRIRSEVKVGTITATLRTIRSGVSGVEPPR
jgi:hypothetical protein